MIKGEEKNMKESRMTKLKLRKQNVEKNNKNDIIGLKERGRIQEQEIQKLARL